MDLLITGFQAVCQPMILLWIGGGVLMGVIFGALPGAGATIASWLSYTVEALSLIHI